MSVETITAHWKTELQENGLSEIKNIHLILWNTGICLVGYNQEQHFVFAEATFHNDKWSLKLMQNFIENMPLLSGTEPITHIWIADERNILIPKKLFDQNEAEKWLKKLHFIDSNESVTYNYNNHPPAYIVYPLHNKILGFINDYFPDAHIEFLSNIQQKNKDQKSNVFLILLNNYAIVSVYQSNELKTHLQFNFAITEDVVYKLGNIATQLSMKQEDILLSISGIGENYNTIKDELNYYFKFRETDTDKNDYVNLFQNIVI